MANYKLKSSYTGNGYRVTLYKGFFAKRSWYSDIPVISDTTSRREYNMRVDEYVKRYRMETEGLTELNRAELLTSYDERLTYVGSGRLKDCMKQPYWLRETMIEFLKRKWDVPNVRFNPVYEMFECGNRVASFEQVLVMMEGK